MNLIVLRASDMESLASFYSVLFDQELIKHRHGKGPEHFGLEISDLVFEIYSQRSKNDDTTPVRLGFSVDDIASTLARIRDFPISVVSEPRDSPWGLRMVLDDPEGHRIELTQPSVRE